MPTMEHEDQRQLPPALDPDESLAFYRDVLGWEVRNDVGYEGMRWITVGPAGQPDTNIVLHPPEAHARAHRRRARMILELMAKGTYFGVNLATSDVDDTFDTLQSRGAEVVQEPIDQPYGIRDCAFRDPAGNEIKIQQGNLTHMATPTADSHDLIRVQGARENNLKDVDIELPKRRLTVFTGVSGSGKSSLVFGTIAAESQRLINETYSTFVQGFMPTLNRGRLRRARGHHARDRRRPGADGRQRALDGRHRHRRQRDAAGALQPAGVAVHRAADGVLVQRADPQGQRRDVDREGRRQGREERRPPGDLPRRHVRGVRGPRHRSPTST